MMTIKKFLKPKIAADESGISLVEFGIIAPVMMMMLMGVMDIGHNYYIRIVMNGVMQDASRSSSLEAANDVARQNAIDLQVNEAVKAIIPTAISVKDPVVYEQELDVWQAELDVWEQADPNTRGPAPEMPSNERDLVTPDRRFFKTFSEAANAQAEEWTDSDGDGDCNDGEAYSDENGNQVWDRDGGDNGFGFAHDVVVMKLRIRYKRLFPTAGLLGFSEYVDAESDSVLANQPFAEQIDNGGAVVRNCI